MESEGFFQRVYEVTKLIPYGKVTTYGCIAKYLGTPKSARMVGWALNALNASDSDNSTPAHRVVNQHGLLTGKHHFKGSNLMQQLLENEGVEIHNNKITNFNVVLWDPLKELRNH